MDAAGTVAFFDIDGTLVYRDEKNLNGAPSPRVRAALEEYVAAGGSCVLCTGRPKGLVVPEVASLPFSGYVTMDGAHVERDGVVVRDVAMPAELVRRALEEMERLDISMIIESAELNVSLDRGENWFPHVTTVTTAREVEGLRPDLRFSKIVFHDHELEKYLSSDFLRETFVLYRLGDGMNDLPAIVEADVGISVDTAAEAVKEGADVILLKKDLNVLEEGIQEGRRAFANVSKYIKITASSNFGNILSIVIASVFLPFFPMTSLQLLLLNLLYDTLCLILPWDHVDEETCSRPLEWSGRTLGRFMRFFGPISSCFDILTFSYLFFVLCPAVCGGSFASLAGSGEALRFIALFQTGWFLESMWTQVLILHLLRTPKVPLLQSRPSRPVMLVTLLGTLFFTVLTFTPAGIPLGLTPLPPVYFGFLAIVVSLYLLWITLAKGWYIRRYRELL